MPTPPSLVAVGFVAGTTVANGASVTTPSSLTWQSGDVVVALAGTEGGTGTETWAAPTTTGTGLTFTAQQTHSASSNCGGACYTATASAGSSGTLSMKNPGSGSGESVSFCVLIYRSSGGVGNSNQAVGSARTVSLTASGADNAVAWGVFDWSAGTVQASSPTSTTHSTASPGPQAMPQAASDSVHYGYYFEVLDDQPTTGTSTYGIGGAGTGPYTIIAVEVKASGGGAVAPNPRVPRMSPVPIIRAANF